MIIGVTGKSGSGKSTYSNKIAETNNATVIHIDEIGHRVLERVDVKEEIINVFGNKCIDDNGNIRRKYLGDLIFNNRHLYNNLTEIVWSKMKEEIDQIISNNDNVILDWLLLPHTHYWKLCDKKLLIVSESEDKRQEMVMLRDHISIEYLQARDSNGIDYSTFQFDDIIVNNYNEFK